MRSDIRSFLSGMETKRPGTTFIVIHSAMKILPMLKKESRLLGVYPIYGEPTAGEICRTCQMLQGLGEGKKKIYNLSSESSTGSLMGLCVALSLAFEDALYLVRSFSALFVQGNQLYLRGRLNAYTKFSRSVNLCKLEDASLHDLAR